MIAARAAKAAVAAVTVDPRREGGGDRDRTPRRDDGPAPDHIPAFLKNDD